MNKVLLLVLMISFSSFSQVQIGADIEGELTIGGDYSGSSVSSSSDGSVIAIAASGNDGNGTSSGHVRVYKNISDVWVQIGQDIDGEAERDQSPGLVLITSVSLSSDGSIVAIGAKYNDGNGSASGHVRIYKNISNVWVQIGKDIDGEAEGDVSGHSVSLSSDGSIVAIGATGNDGNGYSSGHVRIYKNESDVWTQVGMDINGEAVYDESGVSISLSSDGSVVAIGAQENDGNGTLSGHVRIYKNESDVWTQIGTDIDGEAEEDRSGGSISLSSDGNVVAIGAIGNDGNGTYSGHVRIYKNKSDVWTQLGSDINGELTDDRSGGSVSLSSDGSIVAIGASSNDDNGSFSGQVRIYKNESNVWTQIGTDIDGEAAGDRSGGSVSLSSDGNVVVIGAYLNDGNGSDSDSGHVRIYKNISDVWTQVGVDIDGGEPTGGLSGSSVSLSSDGNVVAIGARENNANGYNSGHVRVYKKENHFWTQIGNDIDGEAAHDESGVSLSLSSDGSVVAVGAPRNGDYAGHVRIYKNISGVWTQVGMDIDGETAGDFSGSSVSLSSDGSIIAIGAPRNGFRAGNGSRSGHVRIYKNISGVWTQVGIDIDGEAAGDFSGSSVSLSSDGSIVAIGAYLNEGNGSDSGHVRIYKNESNVWTQVGSDIDGEAAGDFSGSSVSLSSDGSIVAIGAKYNDGNGPKSGHVRVYKNESNVWTQVGSDIDGEAAGDLSGYSVSLSSDGNVVVIGAYLNEGNGSNSGHVRIYKNESDVWTQVGIDIDGEAENDFSGYSVSLSSDGSIVALGAPRNDGNGPDSGHVRIYDLKAVLSTKSFKADYFAYYPNPAKEVLNINLNKGHDLKQVNIYNLQGQYLYSVQTSKIDVSRLSSGIYFVEVVTSKGKSAKKVVIE